MSDLVNITVVGRLTRDAEVREAGSSQVCKFRVATTPYKKEALFFDVDLWGNRGAALQPHLGKGQQVVVIGEYSERTYEAGGEQRTARDIRANDVSLVGARPEASASTEDGEGDALEELGF